MNLDYWKRLPPDLQQKLTSEAKKMEDQMWNLAVSANQDAINCNVGKDPCTEGNRYKMQLVEVSAEDQKKLAGAVTAAVLPIWKQACNRVDPTCTETWNRTVGAARGFKID
jgi:TRAP-type C4-dicarboxylate transport system substrate-binding protein